MSESGLFADVVARFAAAKTDMTVDGSKKGSMDNTALSLSGEVGHRYDLAKGFFVEPQAEVAYTDVDADKLRLGSATCDYDASESLITRVGADVDLTSPNNKGSVYARVSAVHECLGETKVTGQVGGTTAAVEAFDGKDTWVEFGIGANLNITPTTYVRADVDRTEGAALDEDRRAAVGVRDAF